MVTAYAEARSESQTASSVNSAEAADPRSTEPAAQTSDVTPAKTSADPASAEAATHAPDMTSAKTSADPAATEAAAHAPDVTPALASAALGLCPGNREAPGKRRGGQNHHQPFQHGMLLSHAAAHPPQIDQQRATSELPFRLRC